MIGRRTFLIAGLSSLAVPVVAAPKKKIVVLAPLSGNFAPLGSSISETVVLAARQSSLQVHVMDTEASPEKARTCVEEASKDAQVLAILGPVGLAESISAAGAASQAKLPMVSFCPDPRVDRVGVYRWRRSVEEQARELVRLVLGSGLERDDWKRAAVFYPQNAYGRDAAYGFVDAWNGEGRKTVRLASYPEAKPDLRRALESLVGSREHVGDRRGFKADRFGYVSSKRRGSVNFDVLFVPDSHQRVSRILGFLPLVNIQNGDGEKGKPVQLLGLGAWRGETMALTGAKAAGTLIADTYGGSDQGGSSQDFERHYEAETGRIATSFEAEISDAVWWVSKVLERCKTRRDFESAATQLGGVSGVSGLTEFQSGKIVRKMTLFRMDVDGRVVAV